MANEKKSNDVTPAKEYGEVKVIKDQLPEDLAGKTPGSAESGALDKAQKDQPGKTPGKAEG